MESRLLEDLLDYLEDDRTYLVWVALTIFATWSIVFFLVIYGPGSITPVVYIPIRLKGGFGASSREDLGGH